MNFLTLLIKNDSSLINCFLFTNPSLCLKLPDCWRPRQRSAGDWSMALGDTDRALPDSIYQHHPPIPNPVSSSSRLYKCTLCTVQCTVNMLDSQIIKYIIKFISFVSNCVSNKLIMCKNWSMQIVSKWKKWRIKN